MRETRITLPLLFYRAICKRLYEEDFMRFESTHYGIKYIFAHMTKECVMHI